MADQVGELTIHCCYGCQPKPDSLGEYEVNPSGDHYPLIVVRVIAIVLDSFLPHLHLQTGV